MSLPMGAAYQIFLRATTMHLITQWRLGGKEIQRTWPCPSERVGRTTSILARVSALSVDFLLLYFVVE